MTTLVLSLHDETKQTLFDLRDHFVIVCIVPDAWTRNFFGPQISVGGKLQMIFGADDEPQFRVLADDDNFTYFTLKEVVLINLLASRPTIYLSIPVTPFDSSKDAPYDKETTDAST